MPLWASSRGREKARSTIIGSENDAALGLSDKKLATPPDGNCALRPVVLASLEKHAEALRLSLGHRRCALHRELLGSTSALVRSITSASRGSQGGQGGPPRSSPAARSFQGLRCDEEHVARLVPPVARLVPPEYISPMHSVAVLLVKRPHCQYWVANAWTVASTAS